MPLSLTDIAGQKDQDLLSILDRSSQMEATLARDPLSLRDRHNGRIAALLFFEPSTRTLLSFQIAAYRLGLEVLTPLMNTSSTQKGESFEDTILNIAPMQPDVFVIRHSEYNAPLHAARIQDTPVINAGDSWHAHPTQALIDAYVLRKHFGHLEGLKVAICGDIAHSRVARSNVELLGRFGVRLHLIAPPALAPDPDAFGKTDIAVFEDLDEGLRGVDAVMALRLQKERMKAGLVPDTATFFAEYGLTHERLSASCPNAVVLHPGPMNRDIEIDSALADDPAKSLILKQAAAGVPVRMAILDHVLTRL